MLNIAEGNGRFGDSEHRHFLDIAHRAAIKAAVQLDLTRARKRSLSADLADGKQMLASIAKMLLGMRGYSIGRE